MYVQMYLCGITLKTLPINLLLLCVRDVFVLFFFLSNKHSVKALSFSNWLISIAQWRNCEVSDRLTGQLSVFQPGAFFE